MMNSVEGLTELIFRDGEPRLAEALVTTHAEYHDDIGAIYFGYFDFNNSNRN